MRALILTALLAALGPALPDETTPDHGTVLVTMGDGTSLPLHSWYLSYEYVAWKHGSNQLASTPIRKDVHVLWVGKRAIPTDGLAVGIRHGDIEREVELEGKIVKEKIKVARGLELRTAEGKTSELKAEPPGREYLLPGADRSWLIMPRSLDLHGQTVTGTRKEFCLLGYSTLVECGVQPADTVVKVEFQR